MPRNKNSFKIIQFNARFISEIIFKINNFKNKDITHFLFVPAWKQIDFYYITFSENTNSHYDYNKVQRLVTKIIKGFHKEQLRMLSHSPTSLGRI